MKADDQTKQLALEAFSKHVIIDDVQRNEIGWWDIARRDPDGTVKGTYRTEIISLQNRRLFVGGDIDDVVFAYYSMHGDTRNNPPQAFLHNKLAWIGRCNDWHYIQQKAQIGMTDGGKLTTEYNEHFARVRLAEHFKEYIKEYPDKAAKLTELHQELVLYIAEEETLQDEIANNPLINEIDPDNWEWLGSLGVACASRVVYAWAAVHRLCDLLQIL